MEISSMMNSCFGLETRMLAATAAASPSRRNSRRNSRRTLNVSTKFSSRSVTSDFSSHSIRPSLLSSSSFSSSPCIKRNVITKVIPFNRESSMDNPPPDLASYLFYHRIVYLGMALIPAVVELLIAEFIYLNYLSKKKPMYLYINSTGAPQVEGQLGYLGEAYGLYDMMNFVEAPVYTLAVGNAWGESSLLLAAGKEGHRAALPSASIMIKQPYAMRRGQGTAIENLRRGIKLDKEWMVKLYAKHTGQDIEQMEKDMRRPKYFSPTEAVEYGIIDKILYSEKNTKDPDLLSALHKDNPI